MENSNETRRIDIILNKLGKYWGCNHSLNFRQIIEAIESECKSDISAIEDFRVNFALDKLILENCYPELRAEITQAYSKELNDLSDESDRTNLVSAILKWHIKEGAYISSAAMKLFVEGYLEGYLSQEAINEDTEVSMAIEAFRKKRVTLARAAELARKDLAEFIKILSKKNIPWMEYTEEILEEDKKVLEELSTKDS